MDPAIMEDLSEGINAWRQNKEPPDAYQTGPIANIYILG